MTTITPKYKIVVPSPATRMRDLGTTFNQMGQSIETALSNFDFDGKDSAKIVQQLNTLKTEVADAKRKLTQLENNVNTAPAFMRGTTAQRQRTRAEYGQIFQETDGARRRYIGGVNGEWRQQAGVVDLPAAAWQSTVTPFYGRTAVFTLPFKIEATETIQTVGEATGFSFGFTSQVEVKRNTESTQITVRMVQFGNATQVGMKLIWQIVPV